MLARIAAVAVLIAAASCGENDPSEGTARISPIPSDLDAFDLSSPAFEEGAAIPETYSCEGEDISPPLEWSGVPEGTAELILTLQDPDAPSGVFTHWTVFAIDPAAAGFPEGGIPEGALEGTNEFGEAGYGGPCPPPGPAHRYIFTLAARSEPSGLDPGAPRSAVDAALHEAIATTTMTGIYPG